MTMIRIQHRLLMGLGLAMILASTGRSRADEGFRPLFNGSDLSGWVPVNVAPETFTVRDGLIVSTGKPNGILRTDRQYENFVFELEYRHLVPLGNAGVFIWSDALPAVGKPFSRAIEVQILDGRNSDVYTSHGDVFAIQGATMHPDRPHPKGAMRSLPIEQRARPAPEWNTIEIECAGPRIQVTLNAQKILDANQNDVPDLKDKPVGLPAPKDKPQSGYVCLQSHTGQVEFRKVQVRKLEK